MRERIPYWLIAAFTLAVATACDDDPLRPVDVAGAYTLASVNGQSVPRDVAQTQDGVVVILGGQLTLTESGEYDLRVSIETQPPDPGDVAIRSSLQDSGSYDLTDDDRIVLFSISDVPNRVGQVEGPRIVLPIELAEAGGIEVTLEFRN